jgi:hypothetical protein
MINQIVLIRRRPNNSFNPTTLSLLFIILLWLRLAWMVLSGGGLIRALDTLRLVNATDENSSSSCVAAGMLEIELKMHAPRSLFS